MPGERTLLDDDRYSRMATTVTPENVSRAESLTKEDPKMAYAKIQDSTKISSGDLTSFNSCLGVRKHAVRCPIPCPEL